MDKTEQLNRDIVESIMQKALSPLQLEVARQCMLNGRMAMRVYMEGDQVKVEAVDIYQH